MRVFVLVLAIVLLPLRGWMSGAMAMEPVPSSPTAASTQAVSHCHEAAAADAAAAASHGAPDGASHQAHHAQCSLCQICHSVAMTGDAPAAAACASVQAQPHAAARHFASALPQQADKPPIS